MTKASATICIGNTDNKLTQQEWSHFVVDVQKLLRDWEAIIHFSGASPSTAPWQNACWVVQLDNTQHGREIRRSLATLAKKYRQDSIAYTVGFPEFIKGDDA